MNLKPLIILLLALWITSCAKQSSPSGGPQDEEPPDLLAAQPPNESLHFDHSEVSLLFDEFIKLNNPAKNIIISPPLEDVTYKASRKQLHITLPDSLQPNTTYKINFGEAIQDLNEGNPLSNFNYVFATGSILDSLTFSGTVLDAFSKEPAANVKVCLYPTLRDSFIFKNHPAYYATTTEQGTFDITHIREDTFYVLAFKDENNNFRYDPDYESLAFDEKMYYVDSNISEVSLNLSEELKPFPKLACENIGPGTVLVTLDRALLPGENFYASPRPQLTDSLSVDSTVFYFDSLTDVRLSVINYLEDTFSQKCSAGEKGAFTLFRKSQTPEQHKLHLTATIDTVLKPPMATIDSVKVPVDFDSTRENIIFLTPDTVAKLIQFPDSSALSKSGIFLSSFNYSLSPKRKSSDLGTLTLSLKDSLYPSSSKIIYLTTGQRTLKRYLPPGKDRVHFPSLTTGTYNVKIAIDANHNGAWDPVILRFRRQPETVITFPDKIEVKPKWEQTIDLDLSKE